MSSNRAVIVRFLRSIHRSREPRAVVVTTFITFCCNFSVRFYPCDMRLRYPARCDCSLKDIMQGNHFNFSNYMYFARPDTFFEGLYLKLSCRCPFIVIFMQRLSKLSFLKQHHLDGVKRICVFKHSVMTNFNCACPAIQRGQGSGFLSKGSS